ncbi:IclR family transcriptional regulator [Micromonospora echinospora]|uniref:Transcriptional regulator, IclR family n=2 Tax=Micromonospora TaxID=1873 RepID=A0A1C6S6T4_9ACTN|nr:MULTISPECIES: IclR family transcriptional regulator [Micromonospora]OZV81700.1 IclR family transcriptional regulator [Micromonospora echinospora]SCF35258.1 transcriptional regulator, IclR family [Micromonospora echinospora]SCL24986.1 transcriptional regulator, IclR family [Micromonospora pallida]
MTVTEETDGSRYLVRSVSRAAEVLEALAAATPGHGLSVTDVARACGLSKSAAFATLHTLCQHGLAADDGEGMNRRYRLGMALARLGVRAQEQLSLRDIARPVLAALTRQTGLSSRLAVPEGEHAVVIDQVSNGERIQIELRMGTRELPHCTGLGKALLAEMSAPQVRELIDRVGLPRRTDHTIVDLDSLLAHLDDVRQAGYALDDEEDAEGVFCIGSALRDHTGACSGAISVTGLKLGLPSWRYQELGRQVRQAAEEISARLGYAGPQLTS